MKKLRLLVVSLSNLWLRLGLALTLGLTLGLALTLLCSCQKSEITEVEDTQYTINTTITNQDIWSATRAAQSTRRKASARPSDQLSFMTYIFGSDGKVITNGGRYMTSEDAENGYSCLFTNISSSGTYKLYGILNIASGEYPSTAGTPKPVVTEDSLFTVDTLYVPNDVCLGSKELVVTASQLSYSVNIEVNHIMSKLALTIKNVPADVKTMTVKLPEQANKFNFKGEFFGSDAQQTITLSKAETANSDGTYDWTCSSTIVFPCATGTTSMPITIHWESSDKKKDVETTTSYCCLSAKSLSLETTWTENFRSTTTISINDWSTTEQGTFDW